MKKLIAIVTLFLAFSINANAQAKKVSPEQAAQNDITALAAKVKIDATLQKDLLTLMTMKHNTLSDPNLTKEQKASAADAYEHKLMSGLNEAQRKELMKYPDLVKQLKN